MEIAFPRRLFKKAPSSARLGAVRWSIELSPNRAHVGKVSGGRIGRWSRDNKPGDASFNGTETNDALT
jgi:hypothetical protein